MLKKFKDNSTNNDKKLETMESTIRKPITGRLIENKKGNPFPLTRDPRLEEAGRLRSQGSPFLLFSPSLTASVVQKYKQGRAENVRGSVDNRNH